MKWIGPHSPGRFVQEREEVLYWYKSTIVWQNIVLRNPLCHHHGILGLVLTDQSTIEEHARSYHIMCSNGNTPGLNIEHE
jgi:hypothetical protein